MSPETSYQRAVRRRQQEDERASAECVWPRRSEYEAICGHWRLHDDDLVDELVRAKGMVALLWDDVDTNRVSLRRHQNSIEHAEARVTFAAREIARRAS